MARNKQIQTLEIQPIDIGRGVCGNRRRCVIAQAIDRQFGLEGRGYIKVDANGICWTKDGYRNWWSLPKSALLLLRTFDEIGAEQGEMKAREAIQPCRFEIRHIRTKKAAPPSSRVRKDQINAARNRRAATLRDQGISPLQTHRRYSGI